MSVTLKCYLNIKESEEKLCLCLKDELVHRFRRQKLNPDLNAHLAGAASVRKRERKNFAGRSLRHGSAPLWSKQKLHRQQGYKVAHWYHLLSCFTVRGEGGGT